LEFISIKNLSIFNYKDNKEGIIMSTENEVQTIEKEDVDIKEPGMYNVIFINDDYKHVFKNMYLN